MPLYSGLSTFGGDQGPQPGALSHLGLAISCVGCYVWGAATAWRWVFELMRHRRDASRGDGVAVCSNSYAIDAATACGQSR